MSDGIEVASAPAAVTPAKQASKKATATKKTSVAKKPAVKPTHPPASEMVNAAIAALKEKKGSSLQAIKKYIGSNYKVDADKQAIFIKKYLKAAVAKKTIVQTKGVGASGRFKLPTKDAEKIVKKPAAKKPVAEKKTVAKKPTAAKKPVAKKASAAKKQTTAKAAVAKMSKATKAKTPSKAKKAGKSPVAAKPKTPKPKKVAASRTAKAKAAKK